MVSLQYVDLKKPDVYSRQLKNTLEVLEKYGDDHVLGVTVGNEVMLNAKTECVFSLVSVPIGVD